MEKSIKGVADVQTILKLTYGFIPIAAGADKFTNVLTDWSAYLHPGIATMLPMSPHAFMMIVGIIEIAAGILVLAKTRFGAYLVSAWLMLIALTLIAGLHYLDVAVRDIAMSVGAFSLARITEWLHTNRAQ